MYVDGATLFPYDLFKKSSGAETKPNQPVQQIMPNNLLAQISNQRVETIKNDPMYQQQPKKANLFEEDVEVGSEDLFKSSNKNVSLLIFFDCEER